MSSDTPVAIGVYRHYKGGEYLIKCIATHTETKEDMVIYVNLKHNSVWARPITEWMKPVEGQPGVKRFTRID